jgi:CRISPR type III-B/RAMP module-associated protein Cmr3
MKTITLKFTPIDDYFFGKENQDKKGEQNYFLKSNHVPQSTTMLGAVRYWLLHASDNFENGKIKNDKKAKDTIGEQSFTLNGGFDFGVIQRISYLFLLNKTNDKFVPVPLWKDKKNAEFIWDKDIQAPVLPSYDPKKDYAAHYTNGINEIPYYNIFKENVNCHNRKNSREANDKDAYFKTLTFSLKDGFSFGVNIEITNDDELNTKTHIIKMGGENKLFKVEMIETPLNTEEEILKKYANPSYYKLIFLSDAYLEGLQKEDYLFGIINTKDFRSLFLNNSKVTNYHALDKNGTNYQYAHKSKNLLQIIEAGSVLYFNEKKQVDKFNEKYLKNEYHKKAGLNQYVLLKPKK